MPAKLPVYMADWRGDEFYYTAEDLEWVDDSYDLTMPREGAVPRNKDGVPVSELPEELGEAWRTVLDDLAESYKLQLL